MCKRVVNVQTTMWQPGSIILIRKRCWGNVGMVLGL